MDNYERIETLKAQNEIALALGEKRNIQVLQRTHPAQPICAGQVARQEFEYERHGIVNFLVLLNLYNGKMRICCLDKNDSKHLCKSLPALLQPFHACKRVHLIWDGSPSHTAAATASFLHSRYGDWLCIVSTPVHSSWLNQAEILLKCFEVRYLQRGDWSSRQQLIDHLLARTPEYNRLWAQPINRSWTRRDLRNWAEKKTS